ncbi:MAG: PQQ-binding-like beta-propeller repeat protein [Bryobacteraceae bacterium]
MTALIPFFLLLAADAPSQTWSQWGGPTRDFKIAPAPSLAATWPATGPKALWRRELGDGYSSFVSDNGSHLFTLYKKGETTVVLALEAGTGKTLWETTFDSPFIKGEMNPTMGTAPASTPLVSGDRVFAITFTGRLVSLDRKTGKSIWEQDLWKQYGGTIVEYGYTNSPLLYRDMIILPIGGENRAMAAFRASDGKLVWKRATADNGMTSPIVVDMNGQAELVTVMKDVVLGLDAKTGDSLWSIQHKNRTDTNVSTPVWAGNNTLLVSSAYDSGTRAIKLTRTGGKTEAKELWFNPRIRVHVGNILVRGDVAYASSGDFGPAPVTAFKVETGEILWQVRKFAKANFVDAGSKIVALDEEGKLILATLSPSGVEVLADTQALTKPAWTPPTLIGTKVFIRDRKSMAAYELGAQ